VQHAFNHTRLLCAHTRGPLLAGEQMHNRNDSVHCNHVLYVIVTCVGYRWCVPPGAGPAGIIIEVFKGKQSRSSNVQPLLTHTGWYVMQHMHAAVEHSSIENMRAPERWALWRSKERPSWCVCVMACLHRATLSQQ
jgi:hypothetical protein